MKRTDITELFPDATAEQVDKLMGLNGADINKAKGELDTIRGQLTAAQEEEDRDGGEYQRYQNNKEPHGQAIGGRARLQRGRTCMDIVDVAVQQFDIAFTGTYVMVG